MFDLYFYYIACIKSLLKFDCLTKIKEDPLFTTRILKDCEQNPQSELSFIFLQFAIKMANMYAYFF
jgi:hypothetical protein